MIRNPLIILYVDDDFEEFDFFREALRDFDPDVELHHATNGLHALETLMLYTPDCIFLDINMPVMNGWECLEQIKKNATLLRVPVYMISTTSDPASHRKSALLGARRSFVKAFTPAEWKKIFSEAFADFSRMTSSNQAPSGEVK